MPRSLPLILAAALILSACVAEPVVNNCIPVKDWTDQEEAQMSADVARLAPDSPLVGAMIDYARMRAAARACGG